MLGRIAAIWGFVGVCLFLGNAIYKLALISSQMEMDELNFLHWLIMGLWITFMAYFEGYMGFQKGFSPRVASRIFFLSKNVTITRLIFAPLFCLGFFDAERKRIIFIFCLTISIIALVKLMESVPMPWRAIIDIGVVVGLTWGLIFVVVFTLQAFRSDNCSFPAGVPIK